MNKITPHITEKSYLGIGEGKSVAPTYTFRLPAGLTKEMVKKAIEKEFKVHITRVRTIHLPGKSRRVKGIVGRTQSVRKAIVTLKKGEKIAAFEIEEKKSEVKE